MCVQGAEEREKESVRKGDSLQISLAFMDGLSARSSADLAAR